MLERMLRKRNIIFPMLVGIKSVQPVWKAPQKTENRMISISWVYIERLRLAY
jgi:hypothetical protein